MKLPTFAKNWDKVAWDTYADSEAPEEKFYQALKRKQQNKNKLMRVQQKSIDQLLEYIKFLDTDFIVQELYKDEGYVHWFD